MVGLEYGNSKVRVTYNRSRVAVVVVVVVVVLLLPDFIQLQIISDSNKTANIYVKNCSVYIQCKGDIVVVDIKQHKSQFTNSNITITQCQKNFADCVMVKFEFVNCDLCCFISTTPHKEVFSEFFAIFRCNAHFNTELRRDGWR